MDQQHLAGNIAVHQRLLTEPVQQLGAVGCGKHGVQRVVAAGVGARGHGEQVQVVVAQHGHRAGAERAHEAQCFQRLRTAVDQVAGEQQAVLRRVKVQLVQ